MIILLDIDGVMVPAAGWKTPELLKDGFPNFSSRAVRNLNKILSATNASILLTSSHKASYRLPTWKHIFAERGIVAKLSKLKTSKTFQSRKEEVLAWITSHQNESNFVIIDDDKSLNDLPANHKKKLVLTSPLIGLNDESADKAIAILRNENPVAVSM